MESKIDLRVQSAITTLGRCLSLHYFVNSSAMFQCIAVLSPLRMMQSTVEALVNGHPRDMKKVSVTGAGCL